MNNDIVNTWLLHQLYRKAGRAADVVMVNSSWTKGHIEELWEGEQPSHLIYPPCDVEPLKQIQHKGKQKQVFLYQAKIPPFRHGYGTLRGTEVTLNHSPLHYCGALFLVQYHKSGWWDDPVHGYWRNTQIWIIYIHMFTHVSASCGTTILNRK